MLFSEKMLVDSHCHLNYEGIKERLPEVINNGKKAGIVRFQAISTEKKDWPELAAIAQNYSEVFYSIGLHPLNLQSEEITLEEIITLATSDPKINSFGETGLDYYKGFDLAKKQKKSFEIHLEAAQEADLPLIIHTRDAEKDTYNLLYAAAKKKPLKGVLHCFTGSDWLAERALELGLYLSASGIITFKSGDSLRKIFTKAPIEQLLIETDSPFLAPIPYRGKINEPAWVLEVAKTLAIIKELTLTEVAEQTTKNYFGLFNK
jgi:TatD DNase family protein